VRMTVPAGATPIEGPHDNPELWLPRLARILDEQIGLYRTLADLSERQSAIIASGETDDLLSLLGQRQTLVERVTALNTDLEPFTARWNELSSRLPQARKDEVRDRLDTLEGLVSKIAKRDDQDRRALEQRRDAVSTELKGDTQRRGAMNAYAASAQQAHVPRYQDREG
ncbi:MAG: flagellar export chaperone FlgN, partial [Planctomycetota bacterium]